MLHITMETIAVQRANERFAISIFLERDRTQNPYPTFADRALLKTDRPRSDPRPGFFAKAQANG